MTRDRYWATRGALSGMVAVVILLCIGTSAGLLGGYLGGNWVIGLLAGQGGTLLITAVAWVADVIKLGALPPSVRDAFHGPPPDAIPTWHEDGPE